MVKLSHKEYCAAQVRKYDYERYFAALLGTESVRRSLYALYAFNLELASIGERVTEGVIGEMRLQWWYDNINSIYEGNVRNHSVTIELANTIDRFDLDALGFKRMIRARRFDMNDDAPENQKAMENYVSATSGELMVYACIIAGNGTVNKDNALSMGIYWGVVGIIRSIQFHAAQERVYLPTDLMEKFSFGTREVIDNCFSHGVDSVVAEVAEKLTVYKFNSLIEKELRPAVVYLIIARHYLKRLRRFSFKRDVDRIEASRLLKQIRMIRSSISGKI